MQLRRVAPHLTYDGCGAATPNTVNLHARVALPTLRGRVADHQPEAIFHHVLGLTSAPPSTRKSEPSGARNSEVETYCSGLARGLRYTYRSTYRHGHIRELQRTWQGHYFGREDRCEANLF